MVTRVGVIVGVPVYITAEQAVHIRDALETRFPGVVFAVVPGASSVTFSMPEVAQ